MKSFPIRKSARIPHYNYASPNYYFITICTHEKKCIFGDGDHLSLFGELARQEMLEIPSHYDGVRVDHFVVMPNHVHAIVVIEKEDAGSNPAIPNIIGGYKSGVSRKIRVIRPNITVWQRSFHDHVIRNSIQYEKIWNYIENNPLKWEEDCFYQK